MGRESKTQDVIQISREDWNKLNWRVKKILIGNTVIKEKEVVKEDGSKSRSNL